MIVIKTVAEMKKIALTFLLIIGFLLPSCERIYSEGEAGIIAEWLSSGWCYVNNETDVVITLTCTYPEDMSQEDLVSVIKPGGSIKLTIGCAEYGTSIKECTSVTMTSDAGWRIECSRNSDDPWSKYFVSNYETKQDSEIVRLEGKKIRRNLIVENYHINSTFIDLWRNHQ